MKKLVASMLALACALCHAGVGVPLNDKADNLLREGHSLQSQGQYKQAFEKFSAAAEADPASSLPLSSFAAMLLRMAELAQDPADAAKWRQQAEDVAQQALQKHADDPVAQEVMRELSDGKPLPLHQPTPEAAAALHQGELLFNQRKLDDALAHYERAAALDPQYSVAWIYAGDCYYFQKKFVEAEQRFRKGVEVEPLNAQGWRFLADALVQQGKPGPAEGALMSGIAAQPSQQPNWARLNQLRTLSGFPLTPVNLKRKARWDLDAVNRKLNIALDASLQSPDGGKHPDSTFWIALATAQATADKQAPPFATELTAWRKALASAADVAAKGGSALQDPALKTMQMLASADQLEPALLLLQYKESWRPEFEAWKVQHPEGVRKFIDTYQLRP